MLKHIKSFSDINESVGRGAIVLIKGKPEGDKRKLYATHVLGSAEISQGTTMLFLSDDFYRIKKEGDRLKSIKIAFKSEESLRDSLNLKTPGKISIVKNNNKTPWHWITLKHSTLSSALNAIEDQVKEDDYLVESVSTGELDFDDVYAMLHEDIIRTIFFGEERIEVISHTMSEGVTHAIEASDEDSIKSPAEWDILVKVMLTDEKYDRFVEAGMVNRIEEIMLAFETDFDLEFYNDPGDYWTPPSYDQQETIFGSRLIDVYLEGYAPSPKNKSAAINSLEAQVNDIIKDKSDQDIEKMVLNSIKPQWYSKFFK